MDKAEEYSKCMGTRMGLAQICSKLVEMDCYNTGGQCCASNSDGTGTVSAVVRIFVATALLESLPHLWNKPY